MGTIGLGHAEAVWSWPLSPQQHTSLNSESHIFWVGKTPARTLSIALACVPFTAGSVALKLWSLPGELSLVEEADCNEAIISQVSQAVMEKHMELWGAAHRSQGGGVFLSEEATAPMRQMQTNGYITLQSPFKAANLKGC